MVQNDQFSPQQWSEENTAAYSRIIQIANIWYDDDCLASNPFEQSKRDCLCVKKGEIVCTQYVLLRMTLSPLSNVHMDRNQQCWSLLKKTAHCLLEMNSLSRSHQLHKQSALKIAHLGKLKALLKTDQPTPSSLLTWVSSSYKVKPQIQ